MRPWRICCATPVRVVQLADVDAAVCRALKLEDGALQAKGRAWAVSHPRMVAMFLARKHTTAAYSEVGGYFGGRNHSTAVAAEKKVRQWLTDDEEMALGERRRARARSRGACGARVVALSEPEASATVFFRR